jgi:hypothetical protein
MKGVNNSKMSSNVFSRCSNAHCQGEEKALGQSELPINFVSNTRKHWDFFGGRGKDF